MTVYRMLPCKKCLSSGGNARHERDFVEIDGKTVWAWCCYNCGNVKRPRKRKCMSHDYVTKEATTDAKMNRHNRVSFHCFNPNGVYAALKAVHDRVSETVSKTGVPNGALLVHGVFNDYPRKNLFALLDKKRATAFEVRYAINSVREAVTDAEAWIAKTLADHQS